MLRINALLALALSVSLTTACSKDKKSDADKADPKAPAAADTTPPAPNPDNPATPKADAPVPSGVLGMLGGSAAAPDNVLVGGLAGMLPEMDKKHSLKAPDQAPPPAATKPSPPMPEPGKPMMKKKAPVVAPPPAPPAPPVSGKGSKACNTTANKVYAMVISEMGKTMKPEQLNDMKANKAKMIASLVAMCMQQKWPATLHACVAKAKGMKDMKACEKFAPRKGGNRPTPPPKVNPNKIVSSGNAQCDATAKHVVNMLMTQTPPAQRKQMVKMKIQIQNMLAKKCAQDKWPASVHACVKNAPNVKALEQCNPDKAKR